MLTSLAATDGMIGTRYRSIGRLGVVAPITTEINQGVTAAGAGVAAAASGGLLATIGITSAAVPLIGPIVAGITTLLAAFHVGQGCGATCTETTQVVNTIEPYMQQNLAAGQQTVQQNGCLTEAEQQQLEANFNSLWSQVVTGCNQVGGSAGKNCISQRQSGSTAIGGSNWFTLYLTPIQQMPVCPATSASSAGITSSSTGVAQTTTALSTNTLLWVGAAALLLLMLNNK